MDSKQALLYFKDRVYSHMGTEYKHNSGILSKIVHYDYDCHPNQEIGLRDPIAQQARIKDIDNEYYDNDNAFQYNKTHEIIQKVKDDSPEKQEDTTLTCLEMKSLFMTSVRILSKKNTSVMEKSRFNRNTTVLLSSLTTYTILCHGNGNYDNLRSLFMEMVIAATSSSSRNFAFTLLFNLSFHLHSTKHNQMLIQNQLFFILVEMMEKMYVLEEVSSQKSPEEYSACWGDALGVLMYFVSCRDVALSSSRLMSLRPTIFKSILQKVHLLSCTLTSRILEMTVFAMYLWQINETSKNTTYKNIQYSTLSQQSWKLKTSRSMRTYLRTYSLPGRDTFPLNEHQKPTFSLKSAVVEEFGGIELFARQMFLSSSFKVHRLAFSVVFDVIISKNKKDDDDDDSLYNNTELQESLYEWLNHLGFSYRMHSTPCILSERLLPNFVDKIWQNKTKTGAVSLLPGITKTMVIDFLLEVSKMVRVF